MAARRTCERLARLAVVAAPLLCCGCSVLIQNRYSVLGFDGLQAESAETAQAWSSLILAGVAVVSAALGAGGFWLVKRRRLRDESRNSATPEGGEPAGIADDVAPLTQSLQSAGPAVRSSREQGVSGRLGG